MFFKILLFLFFLAEKVPLFTTCPIPIPTTLMETNDNAIMLYLATVCTLLATSPQVFALDTYRMVANWKLVIFVCIRYATWKSGAYVKFSRELDAWPVFEKIG